MQDILRAAFDAIVWIVVPAILVGAFLFAASLNKKAEDKKYKSAMRSGFWAGIILFVMVVVYDISNFLEVGFPIYSLFQGFSLWWALGSGAIIFVLTLGGRKVVPVSMGGLVVLVLTFLSTYALFSYFFVRTYNEILLSAVLGVSFGIFAHFATTPSGVRDLLKSEWK